MRYLFLLLLVYPVAKVRAGNPPYKPSGETVVNVRFAENEINDSLKLYYDQVALGSERKFLKGMHIAAKNNAGIYSFKIDGMTGRFYLKLYRVRYSYSDEEILPIYFANAGDNITVTISRNSDNQSPEYLYGNPYFIKYSISFAGRGAAKYECQYSFDSRQYENSEPGLAVDSLGKSITDPHYARAKKIMYDVLEKYRNKLDPDTYSFLRLEFLSSISSEHLLRVAEKYYYAYPSDSLRLRSINKFYYQDLKKVELQTNIRNKQTSMRYSLFLYDRFTLGKKKYGSLGRVKDEYVTEIYSSIRSVMDIKLRDRLTTYFSMVINSYSSLAQDILDDALNAVQTKEYKSLLSEFYEINSIGAPAYNFSLPDVNGKFVSLDNFIGKVVFIDFWFSGCLNCVKYYQEVVSKVEEKMADAPVVFISVSIDTDKRKWMKSVNSGIYTSPKQSINLYTDGKGVDHPIIKKYGITVCPSVLIIGKKGELLMKNVDKLRSQTPESLYKMLRDFADATN